MSSIVSRRPPLSVSTSQSNDFFWISMRFGTSRTLSSRANERRVRGASMEAKTATPLGLASGQRAVRLPAALSDRVASGGAKSATCQDSTGASGPLGGAVDAHGPRPALAPYVAERALWTAATIGRLAQVYRRAQVPARARGRARGPPGRPGSGRLPGRTLAVLFGTLPRRGLAATPRLSAIGWLWPLARQLTQL